MTDHFKQLADDLFLTVKAYVGKTFDSLDFRLKAVEARTPEKGEKGLDGKDGRDGKDGESGKDGINGKDGAAGLDGKDGAAGINGKDGADGRHGIDGKDGAAGLNGKDGADGVNGKDGANGLNGKDADAEAIKAEVLERVTKAFDEIPIPKDGRDGAAGKDGQDGVDGINGKDGRDGIDGKDGSHGINGKDADPEVIKASIAAALPGLFDKAYTQFIETTKQEIATIRRELVEVIDLRFKAIPPAPAGKDADPEVILRMVKETVAMVPAPKDGRDAPSVEDLRPLIEGEVAKAASLIPPGRDGRDGKAGDKGEDGRDGFMPDDFSVDSKDGGRTIIFRLSTGDRVIERNLKTAVQIYRGVYESTRTYDEGDTFSYGGSQFTTQRRNLPTEKPGDDSGAFRLSVKRGQDAK